MADNTDDFGVLLSLAYVTFVDELDEALAAAGYGDFQRWFGFVLRALDGEALSLRALADRLEMSSPGALKIVDAMVRAGYLERQASATDGRVRTISLTERGKDALAVARRFHAQFESGLAAELGPRRVANTRAVLTAILEQGSGRVPRLFRPT
jgi:DNA-binding MarR family transcriptional regulator